MAYEIEIASSEGNAVISSPDKPINMPIRTANQLSQNYLDQISTEDYHSAEASLQELSQLVARVLSQDTKSGDADDWHNWAVDIARKDIYDLACDILETALSIFPKNIDLLADYLQYGISCGRTEKCKTYYKTLSKIPKIRWGWRGYSFSVSYLQFLWERCDSEKEIEKLQAEMIDIAKQFRDNLGYDEESYRCEADIYKMLHNKKQEEMVLRLALEQLKIAPKCALRLSDILFERGDYEEALDYIRRGLKDSMQTQASINEGYLYYLAGLSKLAMIQRDGKEYSEEAVLDIYSDFDVSLRQEHRAAYLNNMKSKAIMLTGKSGIPVPDTMEELSYLVS